MSDSDNQAPKSSGQPIPFAMLHQKLTEAGSMFEMETLQIRDAETRVYKNAPPTLRELFQMGRMWSPREFLVYQDERTTYASFIKAVAKLTNVLNDQFGVKKGDRVAIIMRNYPEWAISFWAVANLGGICVPMNAWWQGPELEYGMKDSGAVLAIVDDERYERLREHLPDLKLNGVIVTRGSLDTLEDGYAWEDLVAAHGQYDSLQEADLPDVELHPEDNATLFYTSGTTGKPKGALGTHRNIITNLMNSTFSRVRGFVREGQEPPQLGPDMPQNITLMTIPFFHVTGCHSVMVPSYATGGKLILLHHWEAADALQLIEKEKVVSFGGVPAIVWQVLEHPDFEKYDLSSIEAVSYGGAPSAPELVTRIKKAFPNSRPGNGYGLTETSALTTMNVGEDYVRKPDSAGVPLPVCDVKVVDAQGKELPRGEVGELWIKGPNVFVGYWNKPEETQAAFHEEWFRSGDIGKMDDEDFVYILDRAKDMLIRGGENIYSVEIEDALYSHPAVMDAAIVGIPHKVLGEEVGAVVQISPGMRVTTEELQAHVAKSLAAFKVPVYIDIRSEPLPRNANGKILKHQLRTEISALAHKSS